MLDDRQKRIAFLQMSLTQWAVSCPLSRFLVTFRDRLEFAAGKLSAGLSPNDRQSCGPEIPRASRSSASRITTIVCRYKNLTPESRSGEGNVSLLLATTGPAGLVHCRSALPSAPMASVPSFNTKRLILKPLSLDDIPPIKRIS